MNKNTKIGALRFAEMQGFSNLNQRTLLKQYKDVEKTFDEWCKITKNDYVLQHDNFAPFDKKSDKNNSNTSIE